MPAPIRDEFSHLPTRNQRWWARHRESARNDTRQRVAGYRASDPEKTRKQDRASYARTAPARRAYAAGYYQDKVKPTIGTPAFREKDRNQKARRRAALAGVENTLTVFEWQAICEEYNHQCAYCGQVKSLTQDHVIPVSKGGSHTRANVVPACASCNSSKGDRVAPLH